VNIPLRALIVEDSQDDTDLIVHELRRGGYLSLTHFRKPETKNRRARPVEPGVV